MPPTVVAANESAAASPPWLVLALGLAAGDQPGAIPNPSSSEGSGEDAGHGAGSDGSPLTGAVDAGGWGGTPDGGELDGQELAGGANVPDGPPAAELEAGVTAAEDALTPTPGQATPPAQSAELLARWRAATRASGGEVSAQAMPAGDGRAGGAGSSSATSGGAGRRLAELLGQAAEGGAASHRDDDADGSAALGMATGVTGLAEGGSAAGRASELLLRAGAHDGPGPAAAAEGAPPPPPTPLLATATLSSADVRSTAPAAPVLPSAVADQVVQQIVSSIKMQWKDGIGEAKLQLRPDALGAVTVTLRVEHGAVTAVVRTESAQVQEWVLQHQASLRQQMEDAGLRLEELVVSPDEQRQQGQGGDESDSQRRRPRAPRADSGTLDSPRFELLV